MREDILPRPAIPNLEPLMKWHHSLYWRIAVGFVACLALLLLVQAMLFVWVVSRSAQTIPNQPPDRFAQTVALDATQVLERDPTLDLAQYLRQEYARDAQPFFVLLRDGRTIEINGSFPEPMMRQARQRCRRDAAGAAPSPAEIQTLRADRDSRGEPPTARGRWFGRGGPGPRPFRPALIRANNEVVALGRRPAGAALLVSPRALRARAGPRRPRDADRRRDSRGGGDLRAGAKTSAVCRGCGAAARRRRSQRSGTREGTRRSRGRGHGLQRHGGRPLGPRRGAGGIRSRASSTARRRLARAHDAGDGDARLPRNVAHAGARSR